MKNNFLFFIFWAFLSCTKSNSNNTPSTPISIDSFIKGADVSWLTEMEASGKKFYNNLGVETECMALLKNVNVNAIRLRVWVNPSNFYNSLSDVVAKAIRAKNLGLKLMIDFHYSDTWADPANQTKPLAWNNQTITQLQTSIAIHTTDVLTALKNAGVTPTWVQIGNETNNGMLWPEGKASTNMANFALFINAGYNAVKSIFANTKVIVHISNGWDIYFVGFSMD